MTTLSSTRRWMAPTVVLLALLLIATMPSPAEASHTTITGSDVTWSQFGSWNGYKVYLSSPRHSNSGNRGELGWQENINGRHLNYYAGNGDYYAGTVNSSSPYRNLRARGYKVTVSANKKDNGYLTNRQASNDWGADLHVVTHTNALSGSASGNYTLAMYDDDNPSTGNTLASKMAEYFDITVPGGRNVDSDEDWLGYGLAELNAQAPLRVYIEYFFHDRQSHVDWMEGGGGIGNGVKNGSWRYGWSIDTHLGYP